MRVANVDVAELIGVRVKFNVLNAVNGLDIELGEDTDFVLSFFAKPYTPGSNLFIVELCVYNVVMGQRIPVYLDDRLVLDLEYPGAMQPIHGQYFPTSYRDFVFEYVLADVEFTLVISANPSL